MLKMKHHKSKIYHQEELIHMEININFWTVIFIQQTNLYCVNIFIRFVSDEDIPLPAAPQIPGQNTPKPSTSSASERKRQIDNALQNIEAPKAKKPKSASLLTGY
jgi:hypothetical protein